MTLLVVLAARMPSLLGLLLAQQADRTLATLETVQLEQAQMRQRVLLAELEPPMPELLALVEQTTLPPMPLRLHRRPLHSRPHPTCPPRRSSRPRTPVSRKSRRP